MMTPHIQTHAWTPPTPADQQRRSVSSHLVQAATGLFGLGFTVGMLVRFAQLMGFGV